MSPGKICLNSVFKIIQNDIFISILINKLVIMTVSTVFSVISWIQSLFLENWHYHFCTEEIYSDYSVGYMKCTFDILT